MLLSTSRSAILRTNVIERPKQIFPPTLPKRCRHACMECDDPPSQWDECRLRNTLPQPPECVDDVQSDMAHVEHPDAIDPLYLFACSRLWEETEEPSAAWELLAAAQSSHADTRACARAVLSRSRHLSAGSSLSGIRRPRTKPAIPEADMNVPYGIEITETCTDCTAAGEDFFCDFSESTLQTWDAVSHKNTLPAGAVLFVEGQAPRGMFVLCSGRVNLSTTSKEGKLLLLKTAKPGEALGLSASIAGLGYEVTAETATPCQVSFVDRNHVLELMQTHSEFGMQAARCLSRGFHEAYRDIHNLMLSKTSARKLARLLLAQSPLQELDGPELRIPSTMTHEEMAHRIGASRETVTRLLTSLKRKRLIRLDGPTLVIRDRTALEALTI